MDAVKLGFGEHYSDGSGWHWLVELETEKDGTTLVKFNIASASGCFRPTDIDPRQIALAFNRIADALGYGLLDEQIEDAREIVGDSK